MKHIAIIITAILLLFTACGEDPVPVTTDPGTVAAPVFSPAPGAYAVAQNVSISSATPGAVIYYTTDGTAPSATNGTFYTAPVPVASSMTIKAVALSGTNVSLVTSGSYAISGGGEVDVYISGRSGSQACYYKNGVKVPLEDNAYTGGIFVTNNTVYVAGWSSVKKEIWYTLNGSKVVLSLPCATNEIEFLHAKRVLVNGADVYVLGYVRSKTNSTWIPYWRNQVRYDDLFGTTGRIEMSDMSYNNNSLYICGDDGIGDCYYQNSVRIDVSSGFPSGHWLYYGGGDHISITAHSGGVALYAPLDSGTGCRAPGYYFNGSWNILPGAENSCMGDAGTYDIISESTNVFIVATSDDYEGLYWWTDFIYVWRNGVLFNKISVDPDLSIIDLNAAVLDGSIYIAYLAYDSYDFFSDSKGYYWANGVSTEVVGLTEVSGIHVVPR